MRRVVLAGAALLLLASPRPTPAVADASALALELRVTTAGGKPVEGARVSAWRNRSDDDALTRTLSNAAGMARLEGLSYREGAWLSVAHPDHERVVQRLAPGTDWPHVVRLPAGTTRELRVIDAADGGLVPAFRAAVLPAEGLVNERAFISEGLYSHRFVQGDENAPRLAGIGAHPAVIVVQARGRALHFAPLVGSAEATLVVELEDDACHPLRFVSGESGDPVPGVRVSSSALLLEGPLARLGLWTTTDANGSALFCPPRGAQELYVRHRDFAPRSLRVAEALREASIALLAAGRIEGAVVDAAGTPLPGARISARGARETYRARSGPAGRFSLRALPRERLELVVQASGEAPDEIARRVVDLSESADLTLTIESAAIETLALLDEAGSPLAGVQVVALGEAGARGAATSDSQGLARLRSLGQPRLSSLALREEGALYFGAPSRPPRKGRPRVFRVPSARVEGRVVDTEGRPLEGALVACAPRRASLRRSDRRSLLWLASRGEELVARGPASLAASDEEGRFSLRRPAWCSALDVQGPLPHDDAPPFASTTRPLNDPLEDLTITLGRGREVLVELRSLEGVLPDLGRVELKRPGSMATVSEFTLLRGRGAVEADDDGPWLLVARLPGFAPALSAPFRAFAGERPRIELFAEPGAFLVVEAEGAWPGRDATPVLDAAGSDWSRLAEALPLGEGRLMLGPLPRGRYRVVYEGGVVETKLRNAGELVEARPPDD